MDDLEAMDFINAVEADFEVDRWTVGAVEVWPLIRQRLRVALYSSQRSTPRRAAPGARVVSVARRAESVAADWLSVSRCAVLDRSHGASRRRADFLIAGESIDRVLIEGAWYDRFSEPIAAAGDHLGLSSLHLEHGGHARAPRHDCSALIEPALQSHRYRARIARGARRPEVRLRDYSAFLARVGQVGAPSGPLAVRALERFGAEVEGLAAYWTRWIDRTGAQGAVLVDYGAVSMALNLACRRACIPSIELQHGVQGELHFAYGRWNRLPATGYSLLPSVYWTWSDRDAKVIGRWANTVAPWHRAVVGGNPWLELWRAGDEPFVRRCDERLQGMLAGRGDVTILATLQPTTMHAKALAELKAAVIGAPSTWRWLLRLHPTADDLEKTRLASAFSERPDVVGDIEMASTLPLYGLLRHVDVHVTYYSSVVIEAAAMGVASVGLDRNVLAFYPSEAASGWLVDAFDARSLVEGIHHQLGRAKALAPLVSPAPPASDVLAEALGGVAGASGMPAA